MIGALRGYKDTRVPMIYSFVGYWVFAMPTGKINELAHIVFHQLTRKQVYEGSANPAAQC